MQKRKLKIFFGFVAVYLLFMGLYNQAAFHYFYDSVGIRDMCVQLPNLEISTKLNGHALPFTAFKHIEGPGQFLVMNVWCTLAGTIFPLNPSTTALPNIIMFWLAALLGFLFIAKAPKGTHSPNENFAIFFVLVLVTSTWLGPSLRLPWVYVSLSIVLQCLIFFSLDRFFKSTGKTRNKYATIAGLSIGSYLYCGPDWPAFMSMVPVFILLSGRLWPTLKTRVFWITVFFFFMAFLGIKILRWNGIHSSDTVFKHVFSKAGLGSASWDRIYFFTTTLMGPVIFISILELFRSVPGFVKQIMKVGIFKTIQNNAFFLTVVMWFVAGGYHLLRTSVTLIYAYVIGIPMVYLAARFLAAIKYRTVSYAIVLVLVGWQYSVISRNPYTFVKPEDRDERVLAMAAYLNEKTPELLEHERLALLVRDISSNAGHHARGKYGKIIMPLNFPVSLSHSSVGNDPTELKGYVESFRKKNELPLDWMLLNSELLSKEINPKAYEFYTLTSQAKNVSWLIRMDDKKGRKIWLGKKVAANEKRIKFEDAEVTDVETYAKIYNKKYNNIWFLRKDVNYLIHY